MAETNALILKADQLPPDELGYALNSDAQGFVPFPPGSQGNLCLSGQIGRFALVDVRHHHDVGEPELFDRQVELHRLTRSGGIEYGDDAVESQFLAGGASREGPEYARGRCCSRCLDKDSLRPRG